MSRGTQRSLSDEEWLRRSHGKEVALPSSGIVADDIIMLVIAELRAIDNITTNLVTLYEIINQQTREVKRILDTRQSKLGVIWPQTTYMEEFHKTLLEKARKEIKTYVEVSLEERMATKDPSIADMLEKDGLSIGKSSRKMITGQLTHQTYTSQMVSPSSASSQHPFLRQSMLHHPFANTRLTILSSDRNIPTSSSPNEMVINLQKEEGLNLSFKLANVVSVTLLELWAGDWILHPIHPDGMIFYIGIKELTDQFNRQSDGSIQRAQFKCMLMPRRHREGHKIKILSDRITLPTPVNLSGQLTISLYDEVKNLLVVENDVYSVLNETWNDTIGSKRLELQITRHSMQNGDLVLLYGIVCDQDTSLIKPNAPYIITVIDTTRIGLSQIYRPPPNANRTITLSGARVVAIRKRIRMTLEFTHLYAADARKI